MADDYIRISRLFVLAITGCFVSIEAALAKPISNEQAETELELEPGTVESSPVLERWLQETPDVIEAIRNQPSFSPRLQVSRAFFPSSDDENGLAVGIEDVFIGDLPLTINADYFGNFDDGDAEREAFGAHLRYYTRPLGSYINVAPIIGYRHIEAEGFSESGLQAGFQIKVVPSRGGGADFAYTQTWVSPTEEDSVLLTQFEFGYGLTNRLRLATDLEWQFAAGDTESRFGVGLEWRL